ncbi:hypothetical protein [Nitratifractor salsuginis]|nr:hypothetical protein [Nitratifractor salsuginis]
MADAFFSALFTLLIFFLCFYAIPRHSTTMNFTIATNHAKKYGTGPSLDIGDDLSMLDKWKYKGLMEKLLRLKHRIYLESEIYQHYANSGLGKFSEGPDGAQQVIALNIAGALDEIKKELQERKKSEGSRSFLRSVIWGLLGTLLYTGLFGVILFLNFGMHKVALLSSVYIPFYGGLVLTALITGILGGRSWGDTLALRRMEEEVKVLDERAKPILVHAKIVNPD